MARADRQNVFFVSFDFSRDAITGIVCLLSQERSDHHSADEQIAENLRR